MKIIASFDDATREDLLVSEIMQTHDVDTIFYFPALPEQVNEPNGRVSLSQEERQLIASKHEIGSHTITHPLLTRVDTGRARSEIVNSRELLKREFNQEINSFCYPRGYANPSIQIIVQEAGYTNARGVNVGYLDKSENPFYEQTTVHVGCNRKEYGGYDWYEYAINMAKMAKDYPEAVYHLWGHSWELAKDVHNFDKLDKLCKLLRSM